jgi:hypothetical protein
MSRWQQFLTTTTAVASLLCPLSAQASLFDPAIQCPLSERALFDGEKWFCKGDNPLPFKLPEFRGHQLCMPDGQCIEY